MGATRTECGPLGLVETHGTAVWHSESQAKTSGLVARKWPV